ncbi:MAG: hypothetical protein DCO96_03745 [Fluviicola sp. XM-24bin1]|nr:MAG: hypothetical protein DCO96_03745 [Fluviicola sp. XM-24bin1]
MKTATEKRARATIQLTQMVSLFVLLIGLFLGSFYWFEGNLFIAGPISFLIIIAIYYVIQHLIGSRMETKRSGLQIKKVLLWPIYFIITAPAMFLVLHMFNVELKEKEEVIKLGKAKIECISGIKVDFKKSYLAYLSAREVEINDAFTNRVNGTLSKDSDMLQAPYLIPQSAIDQWRSGVPQNDIVNSWFTLKRDFFSKIENDVLQNSKEYLVKMESTFDNWDRFELNQSLVQLDDDILRVFSEYDAALNEHANGRRMLPVEDKYKKRSLLDDPFTLMVKHFGLSTVLIALVVQFLILLPYFLAPKRQYNRDKSKGRSDDSVVIDITD